MLYTSYLNKLNALPKDTPKMLITRFIPKWFNIKKYPNTYLKRELAPSQDLLLRFKKDNDWDEYIENFTKEMEARQDMKEALNKMLEYLRKGNDVVLICYEKDYKHCHRSLIGKWVQSQGIEWKEYNF
ncbi:DUF488 domain-containing protein [Clostridium haemolyticum]|uniref:DUF488 domain-containing protein n=1 Tax=Clostridium haemolyticum NCTC 9693 TaxID=1443114 RepID=A0ABR4TAU6_CLOHA|nr:DUF488 domain-containing protein [Clostridium haemolyticum]KEI14057.1 hypothetical protein Z960_p0058 [Clostridium haemolyticum NCTC 9693]